LQETRSSSCILSQVCASIATQMVIKAVAGKVDTHTGRAGTRLIVDVERFCRCMFGAVRGHVRRSIRSASDIMLVHCAYAVVRCCLLSFALSESEKRPCRLRGDGHFSAKPGLSHCAAPIIRHNDRKRRNCAMSWRSTRRTIRSRQSWTECRRPPSMRLPKGLMGPKRRCRCGLWRGSHHGLAALAG